MSTIKISGDPKSVKEILNLLDPNNNFERNCYCASHGQEEHLIEYFLDQDNKFKIEDVKTLSNKEKGTINKLFYGGYLFF